jgi:hypothetical protein
VETSNNPNTVDVDLGYYIDRPTEALPSDAVSALGLDATGRDGDTRFPYRWAVLTEAERVRLIDATGYKEDEGGEADEVVYWPAEPPTPAVAPGKSLARTRLLLGVGLIALAWVLAAVFLVVVLLTVPVAQDPKFAGDLVGFIVFAAAAATIAVWWVLL